MFLFAIIGAGYLFSQTGPGGVGNASTNLIWVRTDRGLTSNGTTVSSWTDLSGNNNNPSGVNPAYNNSVAAINNFPTVNFTSSGPYQNLFNVPSSDFTVISVFAGMNQALIPMWGTINTHGGYWPNYQNRTHVAPNCIWQNFGTLHPNNQWEISTVRHLLNSTEVRTDGVVRYSRNQGYCPSWLNTFSFGGSSTYGGYRGDVAEMFYFNGQLNDAQMYIIENYLSSKYNLPISNDRYAFESTGHYHDVCGIWKISNTILHDDSQGNTILRIRSVLGFGNNKSMFWGHDNASMCSSTNVPPSLKSRVQRTWRIDDTGKVGKVTVSFDLSSLYSGTPPNIKLLVDNDGNFSDATVLNANSVVGSVFTFDAVNFTDGDYFTFGTDSFFFVGSGSVSTAWTGNSTNWNLASNWTNGIPNSSTDVIIPGGLSNYPIINTSGLFARSIRIEAGASLEIAGNNDLTLSGNWENQGTFIANNSTVNFISSCGAQRVTANSPQEFYNWNINNLEGVELFGAGFNQRGVLTIDNGTLRSNNLLTLISDGIRTASIAEIKGTGDFTGSIVMQRYIDAGATNWRFLTSPVSGATIADWQDNFVTSGYPGSLWPLWPTPSNPWPSIYTYDETVSGAWSNGYTAATSSAQPLNVGQGFWVWCGDTITGTLPFTIDVPGPINKFNLSIPVSYTNSGSIADDGWNMIGNPYPSTIDWDDPAWTKVRLDNAIYIWDPDLQQYRSYVAGIGNNGGSKFVASSQAFWVKANAASPALTIAEGVKDNTDMSFVKMATVQPYRINLTNTLNNYTDQVTIALNEKATTKFEGSFDAHKVFGPNNAVPSIAALSTDNKELSIHAFNPKKPTSFPLVLTLKQTGNYVFDFDNLPALDDVECVYLEDKQTNKFIDLKVAKSYSFSSNFGTISNRFYIHFSGISEVVATNSSCEYTNDGKANVNAMGTGPWTYKWKDIHGKIIKTITSTNFSDSILNLKEGKYSVEITGTGLCNQTTKNFTIQADNAVVAKYQSPVKVKLSNGGKVDFINQSMNANTYSWNFGEGNSSTQKDPTHYYLSKGIYNVELTAANKDCQSSLKQAIEVIDDLTGIATTNSNSEINLFPNPAKKGGIINLSFEDFVSSATIEIVDVTGKRVYLSNHEVNGNSVSFLLPENLAEGSYQLMIKTDTRSKNFRLLIK